MNLATIEAIRQGIAEIAQQAETGWHGDDYSAGAADVHRRVDNYLCELIAEHGGEVKEPEVFRYIEVRKIGAFAHNPAIHREKAQEPGNMLMWMRRIKELEAQINSTAYFVTVCEYDSEQLLIANPEQWAGYTETEQNCRGCMGPCGRCEEYDMPEPEPEPEIPWSEFEDWVQYVAMDEDGQWWEFENEPSPTSDDYWRSTKPSKGNPVNIIPFTATDWRTSSRQRPAKTTEQ